MGGYELLLLLPPVLAIIGAWVGYASIRRSAREIDRRRDALHVAKEQAMLEEAEATSARVRGYRAAVQEPATSAGPAAAVKDRRAFSG